MQLLDLRPLPLIHVAMTRRGERRVEFVCRKGSLLEETFCGRDLRDFAEIIPAGNGHPPCISAEQ